MTLAVDYRSGAPEHYRDLWQQVIHIFTALKSSGERK